MGPSGVSTPAKPLPATMRSSDLRIDDQVTPRGCALRPVARSAQRSPIVRYSAQGNAYPSQGTGNRTWPPGFGAPSSKTGSIAAPQRATSQQRPVFPRAGDRAQFRPLTGRGGHQGSGISESRMTPRTPSLARVKDRSTRCSLQTAPMRLSGSGRWRPKSSRSGGGRNPVRRIVALLVPVR